MTLSKPAAEPKVSVAQAIRDVLIASLDKGQFLPALGAVVFLVTLWLLEADVRAKILLQVVQGNTFWGWIGHGLTFVTVLIVYLWFRHYRRRVKKEIRRLAEERNRWQAIAFQQLGIKIGAQDPDGETIDLKELFQRPEVVEVLRAFGLSSAASPSATLAEEKTNE